MCGGGGAGEGPDGGKYGPNHIRPVIGFIGIIQLFIHGYFIFATYRYIRYKPAQRMLASDTRLSLSISQNLVYYITQINN